MTDVDLPYEDLMKYNDLTSCGFDISHIPMNIGLTTGFSYPGELSAERV